MNNALSPPPVRLLYAALVPALVAWVSLVGTSGCSDTDDEPTPLIPTTTSGNGGTDGATGGGEMGGGITGGGDHGGMGDFGGTGGDGPPVVELPRASIRTDELAVLANSSDVSIKPMVNVSPS